jgi:KaiC/GvpD/RAD55 family RecA-like ATPase
VSTPLEVVERALADHGCRGSGHSWQCPAHEDNSPSLSVTEGDDGRVLLNCHAGCPAENVVAALGLTMSDLFPPREESHIEAVYLYRDEKGAILFEKVRFRPKSFSQRRPDGNGGYIWNLSGVRLVPFRLPELRAAIGNGEIVYLTEGEKGTLALVGLGITGTTTGGAKSWRPDHAPFFKGARVVIVPDNDEAGWSYAKAAGADLTRVAAEVHVLTLPGLPEGGDPFDFVAAGGTVEQLDSLTGEAQTLEEWNKRTNHGAEPGEGRQVPADDQKVSGRPWAGVYDVAGILGRSSSGGQRYPVDLAPLDALLAPRSEPHRKGFPLGRSVSILGEPYEGKSVLLGQCGLGLAKAGLRVVFLVDDEPREDTAERIGQGLGFRHAELNAQYENTVARVREAQAGLDLSILPDEDEDESSPTIDDAADFLLSRPNALGYVLAIDSVHTAHCRAERDKDAPRLQIQARVNAIRKLRKRGVLVLLTGEVSRDAYASPDPAKRKRPIAAGAETRDLEYGSDLVLFLTAGPDGTVKVTVPKNKIGRTRKDLSFAVRLLPGPARFEAVDEGVAEANAEAARKARENDAQSDLIAKIVAFVADEKESPSGRTIEREHLGPKDSVYRALKVACKVGRLEKVPAKGKAGGGYEYRVPQPHPVEPLKPEKPVTESLFPTTPQGDNP